MYRYIQTIIAGRSQCPKAFLAEGFAESCKKNYDQLKKFCIMSINKVHDNFDQGSTEYGFKIDCWSVCGLGIRQDDYSKFTGTK